MDHAKVVLVAVVLLIVPTSLFAQNSDAQALALAAQSVAALTGGTAITDVTLTGNATWTVGDSNDSGPATLKALGNGESRVDLQLSQGDRTEIRDASTGSPLGEWISGGTPTPFALHNCWTDAVWFFPAFSAMAVAPNNNVVLTYVGLENWQGISVQHLQASIYMSNQTSSTISFIQSVSTIDYYLDVNSLLPVGMTFSTHPDDDANVVIPVQVVFSSYQSVNGAQIPFHVQKYVNGQVLLDLSITSAILNSGIPLSDFTIQ